MHPRSLSLALTLALGVRNKNIARAACHHNNLLLLSSREFASRKLSLYKDKENQKDYELKLFCLRSLFRSFRALVAVGLKR